MVWNYEGFARASLLGGRLRLNGHIFYNDYSGLQLPFDVAQTPAADRKIVVSGQRVSVRVGLGGRRLIKTNTLLSPSCSPHKHRHQQLPMLTFPTHTSSYTKAP